MYDDLISSLRICRRMNSVNDNCIAFHDGCCEAEPVCMYEIMDKAADAIEELAAFKAQITDGNFYCMRDGVLYAAKYETPKAKSIQLPPIEFAEEE